jgi:hypothetical protein
VQNAKTNVARKIAISFIGAENLATSGFVWQASDFMLRVIAADTDALLAFPIFALRFFYA